MEAPESHENVAFNFHGFPGPETAAITSVDKCHGARAFVGILARIDGPVSTM